MADGWTAAVAAAARWLRRLGRHHRGATAFDRQRRGDLATACRGLRSARAGGHPARAAARLARLGLSAPKIRALKEIARAVAARRARAGNAGRPSRRYGARRADRRSWHRSVDGRHLSLVMPRSCRCLAGRRPRLAGSGEACLRTAGTADRQGDASPGRTLAAVARRGGAGVVDLLSRGGGNKIIRRPNAARVGRPKIRSTGIHICVGRIGSAAQRRLDLHVQSFDLL